MPPTLGAEDFKGIEPDPDPHQGARGHQHAGHAGRGGALLTEFVARARSTHMALALLEGLAVQALLHEARGGSAAAAHACRNRWRWRRRRIVQRYAYLGPGSARPAPAARPTRCSSLRAERARGPGVCAQGDAGCEIKTHQNSAENLLTERELEVMRLLERRLTNNEIGEEPSSRRPRSRTISPTSPRSSGCPGDARRGARRRAGSVTCCILT